MNKFSCDFETATWLENESYVWAWASCEIGNEENLKIGNDIDTFIEFCKNEKNPVCYFHNEKFDGEFLIYWALTHGFKHVTKREEIEDNTFTTLISDMGQFYSICLYFKKGNKQVKKVTFIDSLKILPFSVEDLAKSFGLEISKLKIDYNLPREKGHILTKEEEDYIKNDVLIVSYALNSVFQEGLTKMTIGSNALYNFKEIIGKSKFNHLFPKLTKEVDADIRQSYKGRLYISKPYL